MSPKLSIPGEHRREAILADALHVAGVKRFKRHAATVLALTASAAGLIAIAVFGMGKTPVESQPPIARTQAEVVVPKPETLPEFVQVIDTDRDVTSKFIAPEPGVSEIRTISDNELLTQLAAADQPAGLAEINGRVQLLPR